MEFTGERPVELNELFGSRLRYKTIIPYCLNKIVLDFGCGVGHGSRILSKFCSQVIGYDLSLDAINEAQKSRIPNVLFTNDFTEVLPVDIVVAVEVLEHIEAQDIRKTIENFKSISSNLIGTTPNGDLLQYHPKSRNEYVGYHVWHYEFEELQDLLSKYYKYVDIQAHAFDPVLRTFTGYTFFASDEIEWKKDWFYNIKV